jgi:ankyrin repeat protein
MTGTIRPPARSLPPRPRLDQLKRQAKELLDAIREGEPLALAEVRAHYHDANLAVFALHDAQLALARAYGFDSWPKLKAHIEGVSVRDLIAAVRAGDLAGVRAALDERPELVNRDAAESDERSAIHHAVVAGSAAMVRLLMERGADPRRGVWPHRGATSALALAMARGADGLVAIMRSEQPRCHAAAGFSGNTSDASAPATSGERDRLSRAVRANQPERLAQLLNEGIDPDERLRLPLEESVYSWGEPIRECALGRRHEMAEMLLERGADPNTNVYAATQAMTIALANRDERMIALLARYGGVATAADAGYFNLVEDARRMLADEAAGRLRNRAVDPGTTVAATLLTSAADGVCPEIVRLALEHLDWPVDDARWHWNLMRPLSGQDASDMRERNYTCFRLMVERSGPHPPGPQGRTILHDVAGGWPSDHPGSTEERVALATILLDAGARLDARDDLLRSTPLAWACRWGRVALVRLLLERGADATESDGEPWATPLAWAQRQGHHEVVALLRQYGAGR